MTEDREALALALVESESTMKRCRSAMCFTEAAQRSRDALARQHQRRADALSRAVSRLDREIETEQQYARQRSEPTFSDQRRWTDDHCGCRACVVARPRTEITKFGVAWMILCPSCGNKRCPHASNHELMCTGSNEPGQLGSVYRADHRETVPCCNKPCPDGSHGLGCSLAVGHEGACKS
jgi:hypothetical protein